MHHMNFPAYRGSMEYYCLGCDSHFPIDELHYTCPKCGGIFLLRDNSFDSLKEYSGQKWRDIFDSRAMAKDATLRGVFRFYELMAPVLDRQDIVFLGEGQSPIVDFSHSLRSELGGQRGAYKNEGQNPSASFKDRGMACAFSFLNRLSRTQENGDILAVCASTGDTSAAAALYASYAGKRVKSVVLLPQGKVTPQQLAQPLGSGARVLEVPGCFDDCMKVVEYLADNYRVALLNSKNAWRILGQESYAFEIAQWYDWDLKGKCVFVPIGNAGNITAIMAGFLKLYHLNIINELPRIFGVQSHHADPVYRYYAVNDPKERHFEPVNVQPSVAQAAMIGNPVSFPRVKHFVKQYETIGGVKAFQVVQVTEQDIMEGMLQANRNGHIACTQGGECLAGLKRARKLGIIDEEEIAILDSTAHMLKFIGFQDMYFNNSFPVEYGVTPDAQRANTPHLIIDALEKMALSAEEYTIKTAERIVDMLGLSKR
ncbi:threonine synthase [Halodesulfovibrio aestuarii]|uniref:Threonine synthase n=1 Tax=Halodesulfovibrio aestuarii TaxID=126333 RepID=A0ABV4JWI8_9BACT